MKNVMITKHITLKLTAEDWDLYTSMENVEYVAKDLNTHVANIFNISRPEEAAEAFEAAKHVLEMYSEFGAADTEPYAVLRELHEAFFKDELHTESERV